MSIEIFLPGLNKPVLVSEDKFGNVMDLVGAKFFQDKNGGINFRCSFGPYCRKTIQLSRYILDYFRKKDIDHKNHDHFDNTNENLRIVTTSQNCANKRKLAICTSKYKGVCWAEWANKWRVKIEVRGNLIHIGYFKNEIEAAKAYNEATIKYFGEFALLNIIPE